MEGYKRLLEDRGHTVTSRWLFGEDQLNGKGSTVWSDAQEAAGEIPDTAVVFAQNDIEDIEKADILIAFPDEPRKPTTSRGGMHVEFGYALARKKTLITVGHKQNAFHLLAHFHYDNWLQLQREWL
jgi:nucleoside 2-deoxyribosyltransferase